MKSNDQKRTVFLFLPKGSWIAFLVLFIGLLVTAVLVYNTRNLIEITAIQDFEFDSAELQNKMEARLRAHAQLLRSGVALFATTDSVTREQWNQFYQQSRIHQHMPGIQGFGYTMIISPEQLSRHVREIRESGFPEYTVWPEGERKQYTSIIYLEPFSGRNLRAFGYDMYSEDVRREAMTTARDSGFAALSGKVHLVQETLEDIQPGTLMYSPVYRRGMPTGTVEERRAAIQGWVYSPYRINDLTEGILGNWDDPGTNRIHLRIYDNISQSDDALLFDSQRGENSGPNTRPNLSVTLPVRFNSDEWIMVLTRDSEELTIFNRNLLVVILGGIIISLLLFLLTLLLTRMSRNMEQIKQLNTELENLNSDKNRFISILGHDLRNPFNSLLGFLEILKKDHQQLGKEKIELYLDHTSTVAKNTYGLLENLMEWSNTQSGNIQFKPEICNFRVICDEVHQQLHPVAEAKNILMHSCSDEKTEIFADIHMIKTILRNLCTNAIKFSHEGGEVVIRAEQDTRQVKITVSDTGVGINPDLLPKLFNITQVYSTKGTSNETGTGLGLIICHELITIHGGKIWAESEAGKGSRFIFTLPSATTPDPTLISDQAGTND
jgi:signal transduction histidine kinase